MIPRRDFLKRSALALMAGRTRGPNIHTEPVPTRSVPFMARAFHLTSVYRGPNEEALADGLAIAPDSVHQVIAIAGDWYRIEHGYVHRTTMQPIQAYVRPQMQAQAKAPFWAELIAPSSLIRGWCDARAPMRAELGSGAVVEVLGTLTDDHQVVWYEVAQGWVEAHHFAMVDLNAYPAPPIEKEDKRIVIGRTRRTIRLISNGATVLHTAYYGGTELDRLTVLPNIPVGAVQIDRPGDAVGHPWLMKMTIDGIASAIGLRGAWDHNRFGDTGGNADLTIAPEGAKTLYTQIQKMRVPCTISLVS